MKWKPKKKELYTGKRKRYVVDQSSTDVGFNIAKKSHISRIRTPVPYKMCTKLRYCDTISLNIGLTGIPGNYVFRGNSMYDPDFSGAGHQPRGFDQLQALYDHHVVIGSKITVRAMGNDITENVLMGITLQDISTTESDYTYYMERADTVAKRVAIDGFETTLTMSHNPPRWLGRSKALSDPELKGSASANPTEQSFYVVWAASPQGVDEAATHFVVELEYLAVFIEPKNPGQS